MTDRPECSHLKLGRGNRKYGNIFIIQLLVFTYVIPNLKMCFSKLKNSSGNLYLPEKHKNWEVVKKKPKNYVQIYVKIKYYFKYKNIKVCRIGCKPCSYINSFHFLVLKSGSSICATGVM